MEVVVLEVHLVFTVHLCCSPKEHLWCLCVCLHHFGSIYSILHQGHASDASGHTFRKIPAVFALIRKDYKYFFWPRTGYEQLFHIEQDPYEEADIRNSTSTTTKEALVLMKARYRFLKEWAQSGNPV